MGGAVRVWPALLICDGVGGAGRAGGAGHHFTPQLGRQVRLRTAAQLARTPDCHTSAHRVSMEATSVRPYRYIGEWWLWLGVVRSVSLYTNKSADLCVVGLSVWAVRVRSLSTGGIGLILYRL